MTRGAIARLPRPGVSIVEPAPAQGSPHPWAVGYVSAEAPVELGSWTGWHAAVELDAMEQHLPLMHIFNDDVSTDMTGFARMLDAVRQRAHLRSGYVGAVVVPAFEHLSPARDGSESLVAVLLRLHFGVAVQAASGAWDPARVRGNEAASRLPSAGFDDLTPTQALSLSGVRDVVRNINPGRQLRGLEFGDLLRGIHGDPDRIPAWALPKTSGLQ